MTPIERVILVDDNDLDNEYHTIVVRKAGFSGELVVLESGVQLIDFMHRDARQKQTLVFIDINMPLLDGFETVRKLMAMSLVATSMRLYILSSSDAPSDRETAKSLQPLQGYFVKPLNTRDVELVLAL